MKKKVLILISLMFLVLSITLPILAEDRVISKGIIGSLKDKTENSNVVLTTQEISVKAGKVIKLIRNIAAILTVVIISFLGIRYMTGSVEEKAGYQKSFAPLIIGVIILMCSTSIISAIWGIQYKHKAHEFVYYDENYHVCKSCGEKEQHAWIKISTIREQCPICGAIKTGDSYLSPE